MNTEPESMVEHLPTVNMPTPTMPTTPTEPPPSYVKLAMRNMVKKRGTSIFHFLLTSVGLIAVLVGLAVAFH